MSKQTDFIAKFENAVILACAGSKIFPSVKMAQACLETGYGDHIFYNNMFGIKASGATSPYWNGNSKVSATQEVINGTEGTYNLAFRQYTTMADSIRDHTYFLQTNKRYTTNGVFAAITPEAQCDALQKAGYATDPNYASTLKSIITNYNLKRLDQKKK
ncbi:MAG: glucosaminidase domain-containing protein [Bacteroidota bacterium]